MHVWLQLGEADLVVQSFPVLVDELVTGHCLQDLYQKARTANKFNVSFLAAFMLQDADTCLDILVACGRLPEATFFARTYRPSRCSEMLQLWKSDLSKVNARAAAALADPVEYPNLFPDWDVALDAERQCRSAQEDPAKSANVYPSMAGWCGRNLIALVRTFSDHESAVNFASVLVALAPVIYGTDSMCACCILNHCDGWHFRYHQELQFLIAHAAV